MGLRHLRKRRRQARAHDQVVRKGGHDPEKVYAAYKAAVESQGRPTVILAKTIKGYGLGEAGEGRNIAHNNKKLNDDELLEFRTRFGIPISDDEVAQAPFYKPPEKSLEMKYLRERRAALRADGGPADARVRGRAARTRGRPAGAGGLRRGLTPGAMHRGVRGRKRGAFAARAG